MGVLALMVARVHACPDVDRGRTEAEAEVEGRREEEWSSDLVLGAA